MDIVTGRIPGMQVLLARRRSPSSGSRLPHTTMAVLSAPDVSA